MKDGRKRRLNRYKNSRQATLTLLIFEGERFSWICVAASSSSGERAVFWNRRSNLVYSNMGNSKDRCGMRISLLGLISTDRSKWLMGSSRAKWGIGSPHFVVVDVPSLWRVLCYDFREKVIIVRLIDSQKSNIILLVDTEKRGIGVF